MHDIYVALNEESKQAMDSNADPEKTSTECIQLSSLVLLHLYLCKVSGMLTEMQRKDRIPPLFCFKATKSFSED